MDACQQRLPFRSVSRTSSSPRPVGTSSDSPSRRCPGSWPCAREFGPTQAARGCADRGLAAHDRADRRADRDSRRARRPGALGELQHLLDPGRGRRGGRRRADRHAGRSGRRSRVRLEGRDPRGVLVVHRADLRLERRRAPCRPEPHPRRRRRRHAARPQGRASSSRPVRCRRPHRTTATSGRSSSTCCGARSMHSPAIAGPRSLRASRASRKRPRRAFTGSTSSRRRASCCFRRSTSTTR